MNIENNSKFTSKKSGLKLSSSSFIPKNLDLSLLNSSRNTSSISHQAKLQSAYMPYNYAKGNLYSNEKNKFDNSFNNNQELTNSVSKSDKNYILTQLKEKKSIKISLDTNVKNTISHIIEYFENEEEENDTIYLTGLNLAISKVILIAEIVKIKIKNLHQINNMDCLIVDNSLKINKEADEGDIKRVPKFEIILTKKEPLEKGSGYQRPLNEDEIKILSERYFNKINSKIKEKIMKRNNLLLTRVKKLYLASPRIKRLRRLNNRRLLKGVEKKKNK